MLAPVVIFDERDCWPGGMRGETRGLHAVEKTGWLIFADCLCRSGSLMLCAVENSVQDFVARFALESLARPEAALPMRLRGFVCRA
jgi:hypothetical protein